MWQWINRIGLIDEGATCTTTTPLHSSLSDLDVCPPLLHRTLSYLIRNLHSNKAMDLSEYHRSDQVGAQLQPLKGHARHVKATEG